MAALAGEVAVAEVDFDGWSAAAADESVARPFRATEAGLDRLEVEVLRSPCSVRDFDAVIGQPHIGQLRVAHTNIRQ